MNHAVRNSANGSFLASSNTPMLISSMTAGKYT